MADPTFSTRDELLTIVSTSFSNLAVTLQAAAGNAALYPDGLPAELSRAMRLATTWAVTLAPLETEPETIEQAVVRLCNAVDAERERRTSLDFCYDFGPTLALNDLGEEIQAGERLLQMRPEDRANWQIAGLAAVTAVLAGQGGAVLPIRAEDNWNVQTTAMQVLEMLAAMTTHGAALLFHGGPLKSAIRAAEDPASINILDGWPG